MTRYKAACGPEAEYEPGSRKQVLRNRLHITSKRQMDEAEALALNAVQQRYLLEGVITEDTTLTASMLRQMHGDWLGDIYEWAGRYRTVDVAKGGFAFPPAHLIEGNMAKLESGPLGALTPCRPGNIRLVCHSVAVVHAELLLIHPFREGNGRLARWLASIMLLQAGLTMPDYGFVGRGSRRRRDDYLKAVLKDYRQDYSDLVDLFVRAVGRGLASGRSLDSAHGEAPSNADDS